MTDPTDRDVFNAASYFVDRHVTEGRGEFVAIEYGDERISYREVVEHVNRLGSALRAELDVRPEERIALVTLDCPAMVYSFFGAIKIGAVPIPTNTLWKTADYAHVLRDSRARVAIVSDAILPHILAMPAANLPHLRHIVVVGDCPSADPRVRSFAELVTCGTSSLDAEPAGADAPAFWLYSSGSTGKPKACIHLHHDMLVCADLYARGVLRITAVDRCFSVAKLFFAYGLGNAMYFPFAVGATAILWPGPATAAHVYDIIERHRPTLFFSVPTNYAMLLAHRREGPDFDLSSVRCAVSAGEALPAALFHRFEQRFGVEILDGIGSTEVLHIFISNRPGATRPGSSGEIVRGYEAKLLDDAGHAVPRGDIGNLLIKGDSICAGYWNQHNRTKDVIEGHWIRTGDKYWQDEDGFFWYAGRSDDMLKVGGIWVSPTEVEGAIAEHAGVLECAVIGRADVDGLVKPAAYVVPVPGVAGSDALSQDLIQFVRSRLADYKRPRWIEFVPTLPKTPTGKIQRFKLREAAAAKGFPI
jgi:benzoate-CoA ligase family protein